MSIVDLAALGESFTRDPYPVYARLRARGPVHRIRMPEGNAEAWLVVGHEAGRAVLTDPTLSKDWARASPSLPLGSISSGPHMLRADPPDHTRLRKLVAREFTARRVEGLAPGIQKTTDTLLDRMLSAPDGRADLVEALSFPLPISVICELLGVPDLDRASFRTWSNDALSATDPETRTAAATSMARYLEELLSSKRQQPGDDLMSALIHGSDDGDRLSADELRGMAWLLLVAGHETTVNLISNGVLALLTHPEQLAALRADLTLVDSAVEEMLRYDGPVETPTYRFTTEPLTIGDTVIPGAASSSSWPSPTPTATRPASPSPTASTSPVTPAAIWRSATGSTTAWGLRWPAWRHASPSGRCWNAASTLPWTSTRRRSPGVRG